jgi:hypothetical protein
VCGPQIGTMRDGVIPSQGQRYPHSPSTHIEAGKEWAEWRKETDTRVGKLEKYQTKIALIASLVVAGITAAWQWILHKA